MGIGQWALPHPFAQANAQAIIGKSAIAKEHFAVLEIQYLGSTIVIPALIGEHAQVLATTTVRKEAAIIALMKVAHGAGELALMAAQEAVVPLNAALTAILHAMTTIDIGITAAMQEKIKDWNVAQAIVILHGAAIIAVAVVEMYTKRELAMTKAVQAIPAQAAVELKHNWCRTVQATKPAQMGSA